MDTRTFSVPLTAFTDRSFDIETADITAQGGVAAGGCGIPNNARAISVNITVIGAGTGYLFIWPDTFLQPNASIINWSPATGGPIANAAVVSIVPVNPAGHFRAEPAGTSGTHVIMDVLGYFATPVATALNCINVAMTPSASTTGLRSISVACTTGFTVTGGTCDTNFSSASAITGFSQAVVSNGFWCESNNNSGNTTDFVLSGSARCCRVPGS